MAHISSGQFEILNPSLNELNLDGLSVEERTRILEVIKKEKVATHFFLHSVMFPPLKKELKNDPQIANYLVMRTRKFHYDLL